MDLFIKCDIIQLQEKGKHKFKVCLEKIDYGLRPASQMETLI